MTNLQKYLPGESVVTSILIFLAAFAVGLLFRMISQISPLGLLIIRSIWITTLHILGLVIILLIIHEHVLCTSHPNNFLCYKSDSERLKDNSRWLVYNWERWIPTCGLICMIYNKQNYTDAQIRNLFFSIVMWEIFLLME